MTSIFLTLAPLPTFMFFGKSLAEKQQRIQSFSFDFLIISLLSYIFFVAYAFKLDNIDMIIP